MHIGYVALRVQCPRSTTSEQCVIRHHQQTEVSRTQVMSTKERVYANGAVRLFHRDSLAPLCRFCIQRATHHKQENKINKLREKNQSVASVGAYSSLFYLIYAIIHDFARRPA